MHSALLPGAVVVLSVLLAAPAAAPSENERPPAVSTELVQRLLDELNSPSRRVRTAAESQLVELGEDVLPFLPTTDADRPAAVREALAWIIPAIEEAAVARQREGSRVTLRGPLTLEAALEQIADQTSSVLTLAETPASLRHRPLELSLEQIPFWDALDAVCREGRVGWAWLDGTELSISPGVPSPAGKSTVVDGLRISVDSQPRRQNFGTPQLRHLLRLNVRIDVEPRLQPLFLSVADRDFAVGNDSDWLLPFNPEASREFPFLSGQSVTFAVDLNRGRAPPVEAPSLRGRIRLRCATRRVPVTISLTQEPDDRHRVGQTELELLAVRRGDRGELEVTLRVQFGQAGPELESHRLGLLHRDVWLNLAEGGRSRYRQLELQRVEGTAHTVRYTFAAEEGNGQSLTYMVPALITTLDVPFTIRDLPLVP